ncbi:hypothetical protein FLONG3_3081 [Fusarium longipes]|uniref:Disintegrin and metalloproteinase domain-containing protein B n=1 Tax=Fusarium longipes TaxID=694270 RepID=A0A395T3H1_9HYPO|nr:hypothetical protein FLONG3_3081 [Fusarium longipes]
MSLLTFFLLLVLQVFPLSQVQALSRARDIIDQSATIEKVEFSQDPHTIGASSSFQVEFEVPYERQHITLNLQPSRHVLTQSTTVEHLKPNKKYGQTMDLKGSSPLIYKGVAFVNDDEKQTQRRVGWARIMVRYREGRHVLEGTFTNDGSYHHISLDSNYRRTRRLETSIHKEAKRRMIVWKELVGKEHDAILQRSASEKPSCGAQRFDARQSLSEGASQDGDIESSGPLAGFTRRQNPSDWFDPADYIGSTDGCFSSRRVALVGIAADCAYTAEFDDMQDARDNIISLVNVASQVYEDTFNIALAIQNLTMADPSCPSQPSSSMPWNIACSSPITMDSRLNVFTSWRNRFRDDNAVWTQLTACRTGTTVGIAWIGSLCNRSRGSTFRGGSTGGTASANVVVRTGSEWQVFAHEMAHNFGAAHDCTSSECSNGYSRSDDCCPLSRSTCDARNQYIMNPQSSPGIEEFSACTIGTICTGIGEEHVDTSCLVSEDDVPDINDSQCGNGVVEPGETCDCGGTRRCPSDSCCNPETCQLREGADCDPTADGCCTEECRVADSGRVCRESTADCDPEERCDGSSGQCPIDERDCDDDPDLDNDSGGSWFDRNRTAVIATAASVGGFIVLALLCCIFTCVRKKNKTRKQKEAKLRSGSISDGSNPPSFGQTQGFSSMPNAPRQVHRYA